MTATTLILRPPGTFDMGGASSVATISYVPALKDLINRPNIRAVWTADSNFIPVDGVQTWVDRSKNRYPLVPDGTSAPTLTSNIFGTKPGLLTTPISRRLTDLAGNNFMPIGQSWSVAGVVHPQSALASNWYILGNAATSGDEFGFMLKTTGTFEIRQDNTTVSAPVSPSVVASNPLYFVVSWDQPNTRFQVRYNGTQIITQTTALTNASAQMVVGGTRAAISATGAGTAPKYIGMLIAASVPVCNATYADDLAAIEAAIVAEYGAIF